MRGFKKAAKAADIDSTTLTRQIQILEQQIGTPLLIRKVGIGIELTRKGEELLAEVTPFFLKMRGFCGDHHVEIGQKKKRKIRIMTTYAIAAYVISDLINAYNRMNPHLFFEVIGEDQEIDIILNDVDIAIRPYDPHIEGIQQEKLFTLEKKLYASQEYLEKHGEPKTLDDLKYHQFLTFPSSSSFPYSDVNWILKLGMPQGKLRTPYFVSNSIECLVEAAKDGMGIISGYNEMKIFKNS